MVARTQSDSAKKRGHGTAYVIGMVGEREPVGAIVTGAYVVGVFTSHGCEGASVVGARVVGAYECTNVGAAVVGAGKNICQASVGIPVRVIVGAVVGAAVGAWFAAAIHFWRASRAMLLAVAVMMQSQFGSTHVPSSFCPSGPQNVPLNWPPGEYLGRTGTRWFEHAQAYVSCAHQACTSGGKCHHCEYCQLS